MSIDEKTSGSAVLALFISIVLTMSLYYIPYGHVVAYPLLLLSTLAHEMGHGFASVLVGGNFEEFVLYQDASGIATSSWYGGPTRFQRACTSAGGLVGPAFVGMLMFIFGKKEQLNKIYLCGLGIVLLLSVLLVVRNMFGMIFVGGVGTVIIGVGVMASARIAQIFSYLIGVQLALSVFSRGDYLFMKTAETTAGPMPSDVSNMANALFLPYWFWGIVCGGVSIIFLVIGMVYVFRSERLGAKTV
jgi:hypothetical protein